MSSSVAITPTTADTTVSASSVAQSELPTPAAVAQDLTNVSNPADLRLVIEEDKQAGTFVYKTVDWRTGDVVQQLPREQVLLMRETQGYSAGQLLTTNA
jgi:flagellar protein FlaG